MHTFNDKLGKEWSLELTMDRAFEIEDYNFAQAFGLNPEETNRRIAVVVPEDEFFDTYIVDTRIVFTMIWLLCRNEAQEVGVKNMEEFAKRFHGIAIRDAKFAFYGELQDFFPDRAMTLKASIQKYFDAVAEMDRRMAEKIDEHLSRDEINRIIDSQSDKLINRAKEQMIQDGETMLQKLENKST